MKKMMDMPTLLHDAKRVYVYKYGTDGRITIQKRLLSERDIDLVDAIENGSIQVENSSDCDNMINLSGVKVDGEALNAVAVILDTLMDD